VTAGNPLCLGADAYRCTPPIIASEFGNNSVQCGSGRHPLHPCCMLASVRLPLSWVNLGMAPHGVARLAPPPLFQLWTLAGARLPSSRASPKMAPRGVASADTPLHLGVDACRCAPPMVTGKSKNGSARCGDGWHPLSRPGVDACRCAPPSITDEFGNGSTWCGGGWHPPHPGVDACRCAPLPVAGESVNSSARSNDGWHPLRPGADT
jgi:hypothetical protein